MARSGLGGSFGSSEARSEDARFITGGGRYTDDVRFEHQAYAAFVRSPYAHARIVSVDTAAAEAAPGVLKVLTGADYAASGLGPLICGWMGKNRDGSDQRAGLHLPLAPDVARYVGDHVAVVVAESRSAALDAAEQVCVDYDELAAVTDPRAALDSRAPVLHEVAPGNEVIDWELGNGADTAAALAGSAHVVELELYNNRVAPNAMEPRAANAHYDHTSGEFTLYLTTQNPFGMRTLLSAVVGIAPEHKLRVISPDVGGGFGSKAFNYAEEVVCLWAARETRRPVKWTAERGEAFLSDAHGREHYTRVRLGLDSEHRFTGLHVDTVANLGAYLSTFGTL
ncbi:MAG: molybdopterin cofactor-binding domain-containing protein, partial [Pseudomonadota bacterium]